jgi:DNA-binding response OmpR family regulator
MCMSAVQLVRSHKILVLCCDDDVRELVSHWSGASGFEVDTATRGGQAAKLLRKHDYRALVMDRFLPPWPGLDSIPRLKRRFPGVRIIVLLNRGPVGAASLLRVAGADAVIEPPLGQLALLSAISADQPSRNSKREGCRGLQLRAEVDDEGEAAATPAIHDVRGMTRKGQA